MQSKLVSYIAAASILVPLSLTAVLLRVLSNIKRKQSLKVHDYLIFLVEVGSLSDVDRGSAFLNGHRSVFWVTLSERSSVGIRSSQNVT